MELTKVDVVCDQCSKTNSEITGYIPGYYKTILKSFWCRYCKSPQVIRFRFVGRETEVMERLEPSEIYVAHSPDTGLTIRPKSRR